MPLIRETRILSPSHPLNCLVIDEIIQFAVLQGIPPFEQEALTDESEPWGVLQVLVFAGLGFHILEHLSKLVGADPPDVSDFVLIDVAGDVCLDEQNVVDLVLAPFAVAGRKVVYPGEEVEI